MAKDKDSVPNLLKRRDFIARAAAGTAVVALGGGIYRIASDDLTRKARAQERADGRPRLPPGQKVIESLRPMGGQEGDVRRSKYRLRVHGEVSRAFEIDFEELLKMRQSTIVADVHCVTGWSCLEASWQGVLLSELAKRAGVTDRARYVIFEAAHGYTANVPLAEAMKPNVMVTHRFNDRPLSRSHGAPVRSLVPDLYFWKSAKWLTGVRFSRRDEPGYWETRGYHNRADPWREQRHG